MTVAIVTDRKVFSGEPLTKFRATHGYMERLHAYVDDVRDLFARVRLMEGMPSTETLHDVFGMVEDALMDAHAQLRERLAKVEEKAYRDATQAA